MHILFLRIYNTVPVEAEVALPPDPPGPEEDDFTGNSETLGILYSSHNNVIKYWLTMLYFKKKTFYNNVVK